MNKFIKYFLTLIWICVLILPIWLFVSLRTTAAFGSAATIFPLIGLIAFTLIWSQIMFGAFMKLLTNYFPNIFKFHIIQGITALLFAILHPSLRVISLPTQHMIDYFKFKIDFVDPTLVSFVYIGEAALLLLICGVFAGLLRNWPPVQRYWHWVHLINYLVFLLGWYHSWNLGGDINSSPLLQNLWIFFLITFIIAFSYRRIYIPSKFGLRNTTS